VLRSRWWFAGVLLLTGATASPLPASAMRIARDPIATTFIYPVGNPNVAPTWEPTNANGYFITQGFNESCDPNLGQGYYYGGLYYCGHTGIDLATDSASNIVHAAAAGVVTEAQDDGGYGVTVRLRHLLANGSYVYSQYEHMQYGSLEVYAGEAVSQGQALGLVGATGFATGAHLHFEVKSIDAGGPGYTFGNAAEIAPFFDPLAYVAAHSVQPWVLITATGHAIPEWPEEADSVMNRFLAQYSHFVQVSDPSGLYVRSGPSTKNKALGVALKGARLAFLSSKGDWLNVALPQNVKGWVNKDWVTGYQGWDTPWPPKGQVAVVDSVGLNVHANPGENSPVVGVTFAGDLVAVGSVTAHWTEVHTRVGTVGWVLSKYLSQRGSAKAVGGGGVRIQATAPVLHVRSGPGTQYPIVGTVYKGTALQLVKASPHWAAVILPGGSTGWVARPYTTFWTKPKQTAGTKSKAKAPTPAALRAALSRASVYSGPGANHRVIAHLAKKEKVQLLGLTTHWAHIALPATKIDGWVLRRLLH
jgi:uncharacterized protein YgiM (DUF1202 family)